MSDELWNSSVYLRCGAGAYACATFLILLVNVLCWESIENRHQPPPSKELCPVGGKVQACGGDFMCHAIGRPATTVINCMRQCFCALSFLSPPSGASRIDPVAFSNIRHWTRPINITKHRYRESQVVVSYVKWLANFAKWTVQLFSKTGSGWNVHRCERGELRASALGRFHLVRYNLWRLKQFQLAEFQFIKYLLWIFALIFRNVNGARCIITDISKAISRAVNHDKFFFGSFARTVSERFGWSALNNSEIFI